MPRSPSSDPAPRPSGDRNAPVYTFGPFRLDPSERQLERDGTLIELTPKAFDTLVVLVRHHGRLVTKDELMEAVWPDTIVEENYLSVNISKVRAALDESAREGRYIETVVGHGYRFRSEVDVRPQPAASPAASPPAPAASPPSLSGVLRHGALTWRTAVGAVLLILLGSLLTWGLAWSDRVEERSIAVLPLQAFPTPPSTDTALTTTPPAYLRLGIADAIVTKLGNLDPLIVRPTSAVLPFQAPDTDPIEAGRALGVDVVLSGFLQQQAGRLRLTMQLIDVAATRSFWSASFEAPFTDVFAVQDAIATQVAQTLTPEMAPDAASRMAVNYTHDTAAYAAYLKGRYYWNQRTDDGLRRSLDFYREALDHDPTYALAYLGLAETYSLLVWYSGRTPSETFPQARAAAKQALRIDSTLAEAYATLALVAWQHDWDAATAEQAFQRALALKPYYAGAHHGYGQFLALTDRPDEGIAHLEQALALDPLSQAIQMDLGSARLFAREYERAATQYRRLLDRAPQFAVAHVFLGLAHELQGNYDAALAAHTRALQIGGRNPLWLAELARAHALAGHAAEADALLDELQTRSTQRYVSPFALALVHVALDRPDQALLLLEEAISTRDPYLIYLHVHPHLDPLRPSPRFAALLGRVPLAFAPKDALPVTSP